MATKYIFNNREEKLPGAYATIKSLIDNPPATINYGRVLVIDNGTGAGYGGGSGIDGSLFTGEDAIYRFSSVEKYQSFLKGGIFWKAAEALFKPYNTVQGVSEVIHVKAATTTAATMIFTATGGGAAGGSFKVHPKDEGLAGNGAKTSEHLDSGYAYTIETGVKDPNKWIFKIWLGTFKGLASDSIAYDEIAKADTKALLLAQSPEFNNIQNLIDWGRNDAKFNEYFVMDATSAVVGLGTVTSADISALTGVYQLASGGTESYTTANLDTILEIVQDIDYAWILSDQFGTSDYDSASSTKMFAHIRDEAKFDKFMIVGGGADEDEWDTADGSISIAGYFDSPKVVVVHSNIKKTSRASGTGFRVWNTLIHSAYVLGRICGLQPQVPITRKPIAIEGLVHNLKKSEKEVALDSGVLVTEYNQFTNNFCILQGVNSIQNNDYQINQNGTSYSIQIMRIVSQINRELITNTETDLLSDERGVNMNTLSPGTLKNWVADYLSSKVATQDQDNLIVATATVPGGYQNVIVTRDQDAYFVSYEFVPNGEITKIFFTGFMVS